MTKLSRNAQLVSDIFDEVAKGRVLAHASESVARVIFAAMGATVWCFTLAAFNQGPGNLKAAMRLSKELGGTGRRHDWAISRRIRDAVHPLPLFLAGGLNAGNVAQAVATVQPHGLDLCSSVRSAGTLDGGRLSAFFDAVRSAASP